MSIQIQDDILRRCLDFFGLRGVVTHSYEQTVLPTVNIGDLGQPTRLIRSTNTSINSPWGAVPLNKSWRPIYAAGQITQAAGAAARVYAIGWQWNAIQQGLFPFWAAQSTVGNTVGEIITRLMVLNTTDNFVVKFPPNFILPAGAIIDLIGLAGDGTTSIVLGAQLLVHEFGENLILQS